MDRRKFLLGSTSFLAGSLFTLGPFSRVSAFLQSGTQPFHTPRIALIIDDIGFSSSRTRNFLKLGVPLTFSILPRLQQTRDLAAEIHENGHEVMLHQPMEPYDSHIDPGPGALYKGFKSDVITGIFEENLDSVPFAIGVNNHMGSKFTECKKEVNDVLSVINNVGLFFVDSLTTSRSKAYETARSLHMPTACRNRFLDNIPVESAIRLQLRKLMHCALKYGHAIGIGHPYPETAKAVRDFLDEFYKHGVNLVPVSKVLSNPGPSSSHGDDSFVFGDYT